MHRLWRMRGGLQECERNAFRSRQNFTPWAASAGPARKGTACLEHGSVDGRRRVWQLHGNRFLRSGLSKGDQPRVHRPDEPPIRRRSVERKIICPAGRFRLAFESLRARILSEGKGSATVSVAAVGVSPIESNCCIVHSCVNPFRRTRGSHASFVAKQFRQRDRGYIIVAVWK